MTPTVVPGLLARQLASTIPAGHYDCQWEEPSKLRPDKYPPFIRRQSWVIQNTITKLYLAPDGGRWVAQPEQALSCLWFKHIANLINQAPHLFPPVEQLQLVLKTFYCDPKTFPHGWFADE